MNMNIKYYIIFYLFIRKIVKLHISMEPPVTNNFLYTVAF